MTNLHIRGYSRYVNLMRILLPVGILLAFCFAFAWPYFYAAEKEAPLVIDTSSPEIQENRMMNPHYMSTDKKGQPFNLDADWAKRKNEDVSDLVQPHGTLAIDEGESVNVKATAGQYDNEKKVLKLEGNVTLTTTDGYSVMTHTAQVDTESKIIEGDTPISGSGPAGSIKGEDGFKVETREKGQKIITLKGRSQVVINKAQVKKKKDSDAS